MRVFILEDSINRNALFREIFAPAEHVDLTIAECAEDAIRLWKPPYDLIMLDHDLEDAHYRAFEKGEDTYPGGQTGYDFVKWMITDTESPQGVVIIHSFNPVGAEKMEGVLKKAGWYIRRLPFGMELLTQLQTMVRPV